jgi:hypothetical protein
VAEAREAAIYGRALDLYAAAPTLPHLHSKLPWPLVRERLENQKDEALESVEADRAALRETMVEHFEAGWRLRRDFLRLLFLVGVGCGLAALAYVLLRHVAPVPFLLNSRATFVLLVAGAVSVLRDPMLELLLSIRKRRFVQLDLEAAEKLLERAIREVALPALLRQLHQFSPGSFSTAPQKDSDNGVAIAAAPAAASSAPRPGRRLQPLEAQNLVELFQSPQQIPTEARNRLKTLVGSLRGASLGIAGPRGIGKTSLLQWFFDHQTLESDHLAVRIAAPVRYEPRDFVLATFAQLCEAMMKGNEGLLLPGRDRFLASPLSSFLGAALIVIGGLIYATSLQLTISPRHAAGLGLMAAGAGLLLMRFSPQARATSSPRYLTKKMIRASSDPEAIAPDLLRDIYFQLTFATGYSGKLQAGPGELGAEASYSLAVRQESYPDVVAKFRAFLEATAEHRGRVYIGIDELDKLQVGDAVRFLDDIKGLFGVPDCFFLMCISEDALGQFERRGLPMRDAFDSAFDEVIRIEPLRADESIALLELRTEISPGLASLCHVLAGGIPREDIRHARRLAIVSQRRITVEDAVEDVVYEDLQERIRGMKLAGLDDFPLADPTIQALCMGLRPEASLLDTAGSFFPSAAALACLFLLAATILELAERDLEVDLRSLRTEADALAAVKLQIGENPDSAWSLCMEVRARQDLSLPTGSTA